jgi:hypothetical protein
MRMPRWLVVSLLSASVLTVLGAGAWWWVTWPDMTLCHFLDLARTGQLNGREKMIIPKCEDDYVLETCALDAAAGDQLVRDSVSLGDMLLGIRRLHVPMLYQNDHSITVCRGSITLGSAFYVCTRIDDNNFPFGDMAPWWGWSK